MHLLFDGIGDIDDDSRFVGLDDIELANLMRLVLRKQLGESQVKASQRIHAVEYNTGDDSVISMRDTQARPSHWILRYDEIRLESSDLSRDVEPQLSRILHFTIGKTQELPSSTPSMRAASICSRSRASRRAP